MIAGRSLVVRQGVRLASPFAIVVGVMLFFSGHNQPGGGFAAGLVLGSVLALRIVVGIATPVETTTMLSVGGVIVGAVAIAPMLVGSSLLDMVVVETTLPLLGKVKSGTALLFDLGVSIIVVGLVSALLDGLGVGRLDEHPDGNLDDGNLDDGNLDDGNLDDGNLDDLATGAGEAGSGRIDEVTM